jgi:hypothetical protein
MPRKRNFIDPEVFAEVLSEVRRVDGKSYEDIDTAYGDMSRLVVAWIACTPATELQRLYSELGWESSCNVRQCQLAAKRWLEKFHPGRHFPVVECDQLIE